MKLTLDTLKESGAFTGRPVEKEIKWKGRDGKEHIATVYVRPMGYHTLKLNCWRITANQIRWLDVLPPIFVMRKASKSLLRQTFSELHLKNVVHWMARLSLLCYWLCRKSTSWERIRTHRRRRVLV
ncbi:Uncharacterised protein [Klebsiella michiganensis]|uniref:Uncharacterized protein n=1 Tax=Klebsiella michiganensis TaxID=1134687 RepID=A0A7H4N311_9ENTR|nr:Uncharacterised protein [Klebsiella michiganensis]